MLDISKSEEPGLFGLANSNRNFKDAANWGKNIFNNTFPVALACHMNAQSLTPVYLTLDENAGIKHSRIDLAQVFGMSPTDDNIFFAFESDFVPYRPLVTSNLPRADLVVMNSSSNLCTSVLEIKLTALPDNSTYNYTEDRFGCELVVRPDSIVYMALSIVYEFKERQPELLEYLKPLLSIQDWTDIAEVSTQIPHIAKVLDSLMQSHLSLQRPFVLQPIWKTVGRRLQLHDNAFDVFVWSDFAFTRLFFKEANKNKGKPSRGARTIAWFAKMLLDFAINGKIDHKRVIDSMSFNTKNDKAFAVNGKITQPYMACAELTNPRIRKEAIKSIILGGGEKLLSPERRLDAAIINTI